MLARLTAERPTVRPAVRTSTLKEEIKDQLLLEALDDWVGLWDVLGYFEDLPESARKRSTLAAVDEMLRSGWFEAGFPTLDGTFEAWPLSVDASLRRISDEWAELGKDPSLGDIAWFNLTPLGEANARRTVRRA